MKRLLLLLLFLPIIGYSQYPGTWFRASQWVNSPMYQLNGVNLDSANTVKRGFFTKYQYNKLQSKENNLGNPSVNGYVLSSTTNGVRSWVASSLNQYPNSGIALSTGSGWGSSITDNSANWNAAYGWGNWASNFGTTVGTIAQGNDSRITNGQTAFGWGNHASAGYELQANKTTSISSASTDVQYPSAKSVYTAIGSVNASSVVSVPSGGLSATNVQNALNELDNEKIGGSGTVGTIPLFTGTAAIGNSPITVIGSNITSVVTQKTTADYESAGLGAELLTSAGWTSTDWTGSFGTGFAHTVGNTTSLTNTLAAVVGNSYQITYTVTGRTAGTFTVTFGGQSNNGLSATGNYGPKATTVGGLTIAPTSDFNGTIIISIKLISPYLPFYSIQDNTGASSFEVRNSPSSLGNTFSGVGSGRMNTTGFKNNFQGYQAGYSNTTGTYNNFQGDQAGYSNTTGYYNNFQGYQAGFLNTTGYSNNFQGALAGYSNTTGANNNFQGYAAGYSNTTGANNNFQGYAAGYSNTTGTYNNFQGYGAGYSNTTGTYNNFQGYAAGYSNTTGSYNNFQGYRAGQYIANGITANTTSDFCTLIGDNTRVLADNDQNEIVIGSAAIGHGSNTATWGSTATTAHYFTGNISVSNTSTGVSGGYSNSATGFTQTDGFRLGISSIGIAQLTQYENLGLEVYTNSKRAMRIDSLQNARFFGSVISATAGATTSQAGTTKLSNSYSGTSEVLAVTEKALKDGLASVGTSIAGETNAITLTTKVGIDAGLNEDETAERDNCFYGYRAGYSNTTGSYNNFQGYQAGYSNTTGTNNNFQGALAGYLNTTGGYNNFQGYQAGYSNTTGTYNNFQGYQAGFLNTTGYSNNFQGALAGYSNTTGANNNFQGYAAGYSNTTGANNNFQGYAAGYYNTTGGYNNFQGYAAGYSNTTGTYNNFQGYQAGQYIANGITENTTSDFCTLIGDNTRVLADNDQNEIVIGSSAIGHGSNTATWGNTATTAHYFVGSVKVNGSYNFGSDAGSTDDYTVTIDGITSYTVGMVIYFKANSPNAGACTINVSSLGAKSLKMKHDQDPSDNFIEAGSIVQAVYDGTNFQMMQPNAN